MGLIGRVRRKVACAAAEFVWAAGGWLRGKRALSRDAASFRRVDPFIGAGPGRWLLTDSIRNKFRRGWFRLRRDGDEPPASENCPIFQTPKEANP